MGASRSGTDFKLKLDNLFVGKGADRFDMEDHSGLHVRRQETEGGVARKPDLVVDGGAQVTWTAMLAFAYRGERVCDTCQRAVSAA